MTPNSTAGMCVGPDDSVRRVMETMDSSRNELVLVTGAGNLLIGTISDGDVRRGLLAGKTLGSTASEIMNRRFTTVPPGTGRAEALDLMKARRFRHLPIVDADGVLVGIHLLRELIGGIVRPNAAVMMVGGRGTRLAPLTHTVPKPMLPIAGRPILERLVLHLVGHGIRRIHLAVNYLADIIEAHFRDGAHLGCRISYLREEHALGTGGALSLLDETPAHPLLVMNGDLVTQADIGRLLDHHSEVGNRVTLATREHLHTVPFGVVKTDGDRIVGVQEKPTQSWTINAGMYVIDPDLIERIPRGEEYALPTLIEDCLRRGEQTGVFNIEDGWIDVGHRSELDKAQGRT